MKTIKHYECRSLCRILDRYAHHMLVVNPNSCIASILGVYRVKLRSGKKKYYLVARNVYSLTAVSSTSEMARFTNKSPSATSAGYRPKDSTFVRKYDLKGSTVGRKAAVTSSVRKDLDILASGE